MISNLEEYFLPEQEFYLNGISYKRIDSNTEQDVHSLNCIDNISTDINGDEVRVIVTRVLKFDPEEMFELSVSFGVNLNFVPDRRGDFKWEELDLADEFKENGEFATGNLMSRITLLIAQITSSFGQMPLILPPVVAGEKMEE